MKVSRTGRRFLLGATSLVAATTVGAFGLAAVEEVALIDGYWLSFSVVSTAGYEAPTTDTGRVLVMVVFVWALASYLVLLTAVAARARRHAEQQQARSYPAVAVPEDEIRRVIASIRLN